MCRKMISIVIYVFLITYGIEVQVKQSNFKISLKKNFRQSSLSDYVR